MQANLTVDRAASLGGARLWARLVLALSAALAFGFGLGYVTEPATHPVESSVRVVTAPATNDQCVEFNCPTHRFLP